MSVDPLVSKYPSMSPYNYVGDDPTGLVDPNGMRKHRPMKLHPNVVPINGATMHGSESGSASVAPTITVQRTKVRTNLPFLKVATYTSATTKKGSKYAGQTFDEVTGNLNSNSYTTPGGEVTTIGAEKAWWTIGTSSLQFGESARGKYIVDLSTQGLGNSRMGLTIQIDSPEALAHQAAQGFVNVAKSFFNSFAKGQGVTPSSEPSMEPEPPALP